MTWVQRACGLLKVEGLVRTLKSGYLDWGRKCFIEANNDNRSKSLLDYAKCHYAEWSWCLSSGKVSTPPSDQKASLSVPSHFR
jgi:hypothetical protein